MPLPLPLKKLLDRARAKLPSKSRSEKSPSGAADSSAAPLAADGERPRAVNLEKRPQGLAPRVTLSGPLLIALSLVLVCAVAWAFFMGLMVGRGQNPQENLPTIAGMLDSERAAQGEAVTDAEGVGVEEASSGETQPPSTQGPSGVLPVPAPSAAIHAPPTGNAARAWPDAEKPRAAKATKKPAPVDNQKYDYIYQAGAFRANADAVKVQRVLNGKGVRVSVRRSGKVYLVMVNFRGTPAEMDRVLGRMRAQGLTKPLQLAKTPVETKPVRQPRKRQ